MAQVSRVAIVLGAGPNVGTKVAQRFTTSGYKVAVVSRSGKPSPPGTAALSLAADFSGPSSISDVFNQVRAKLGEPSLVVYNAAAAIFPASTDPFAIDVPTFASHLAINTTSAYAAAREALQSFKSLAVSDPAIPKAFIYTGNFLNEAIMLPALTLGVGKAASAHFVEMGAKAYGEAGYGFYYADERTAEGAPVMQNVDGDAHAELYYGLASEVKPRGWHQTFVKGKGYVKF